MKSPLPDLTEMMAQLVASPSVSSVEENSDQSNQGVVDLLSGWLEDAGFGLEQVRVPGQDGKVNLIATLGSGDHGLVLSGHTDTVPFDEHLWQSDPFALREADGRLYGLGICDMKGFLALALAAASEYRAGDLKQPLILLATADEETAMAGAMALEAAGKPRARHAVIGEPTSMKPVRMHKGMMVDAIHVHGRAGHSSKPAHGANALEGMHRVMTALMQWREELAQTYHLDGFDPPGPTLNLGYIRGGDSPNRIPAECELRIDLRPLPDMDRKTLRVQMREVVARALEGTDLNTDLQVLFEGSDPMHTPADAQIIQLAEELTGHPAGAVGFSTEAPYLTRLGMDVVVLGPGNIEQAHQPDEYLEVSRIEPTLILLRRFIERFCVK